MTMPYPHLLKPLTVAGIPLRNRSLMGSMHTGLEEEPRGFERLAAFYAERAKGEAGLIVTGGFAPNDEGKGSPWMKSLQSLDDVPDHRLITQAVHAQGGHIALQILHTGRYGYHENIVSSSAIRAPINGFTPRALDEAGIARTIEDYAQCAALAREAGYDGVEIMGSEGYFINQFTTRRVNKRDDDWGGSLENRIRLPVEIVRRVRAKVGSDFIVIYRISMLDLVEDGNPFEEVVAQAKAVEAAGVDILNTGIGWHEARIPTIASMVPRGAFAWVTRKMRPHVGVPLVTTNRINDPAVAEEILARGDADMVSMARPFLADPHFTRKARENRAEEINTCIACNQACLDHIFEAKPASCLVNPLAGRETEWNIRPATEPKRVAVVGAGPAGLSFATTAAERGHFVTLFEAADRLGGQFNLAAAVPGKEEYAQTIRYFAQRMRALRVEIRLNTPARAEDLVGGGFDFVAVAAGVRPRHPPIDGIDHPCVVSYPDVLSGKAKVGQRVAIIGAGGIGVDTASFLSEPAHRFAGSTDAEAEIRHYLKEWGIDESITFHGGLLPEGGLKGAPREITILKRSKGKIGANLGKTTVWIHREALKRRGVRIVEGVHYERINDAGLHYRINGEVVVLPVDTVIVCAGQEPARELSDPLIAAGIPFALIGGADEARELDAKRAIEQGMRVAAEL